MRAIRKVLFWCHLAAGSLAGAVILVLCATGVLLAFQPQALRLVERNARRVPSAERGARRVPARSSTERLGAGTLLRLAAESAAASPGDSPTAVTLAADPAEPITVAFGRERILFLDPATGAVLGRGSRAWRAFFASAQDLHRWLSLGGRSRAAGEAVTGAANLLFLGLALSGLYIWWPRLRGIRRVSAVAVFHPASSAKARDFNWHNVVGVWSALPLMVITVTALPMSYRWAGDLVYRIAGSEAPAPPTAAEAPRGDRAGRPAPAAAPAVPPLSAERASTLDALGRRAEAQSEGWRAITLRVSANDDAPASVVFTIEESRFANRFARSQLTFDAATGEIRKWEPYAEASGGRRVRSWMRFLHTGEALGITGQLVAALASLGGAVLVVTGLSLALRRLRSWRARRTSAAGVAGVAADAEDFSVRKEAIR